MDCLTNEFKAVDVPGLDKLTEICGYSYAATYSGRLFISGGYKSPGTLHEAVWTGLNSMALEERHPMITARYFHHMTSGLMVTGGQKKEDMSETNLCEVYDKSTNSWQSIPPMNEKRWKHTSVEVKHGLVYVFGGYDEE